MKKIVAFMLCMMFALGMSYAQTIEETTSLPDTLVQQILPEVEEEAVAATPTIGSTPELTPEFKDALFNAMFEKLSEQGGTPAVDSSLMFVPIKGKSKFAKNHYIYQMVEISAIAEQAKDEQSGDDEEQSPSQQSGSTMPNLPSIASQIGTGMNIGYSVIFVPGQIKNDKLELNRFGFAYSTGFIASFHKEQDREVTCNLMTKFGVEAGNRHALGVGIDALIGGGKGQGTLYYYGDGDDDTNDGDDWQPTHYTEWCFKFGGQIWINTKLLSSSVQGMDVLAFARFVKSCDPNPKLHDDDPNIYNAWIEEAWQFGVTLRYCF